MDDKYYSATKKLELICRILSRTKPYIFTNEIEAIFGKKLDSDNPSYLIKENLKIICRMLLSPEKYIFTEDVSLIFFEDLFDNHFNTDKALEDYIYDYIDDHMIKAPQDSRKYHCIIERMDAICQILLRRENYILEDEICWILGNNFWNGHTYDKALEDYVYKYLKDYMQIRILDNDDDVEKDWTNYIFDYLKNHNIKIISNSKIKKKKQISDNSHKTKTARQKSKEKYRKKLNKENEYSFSDTLEKADIEQYKYLDEFDQVIEDLID